MLESKRIKFFDDEIERQLLKKEVNLEKTDNGSVIYQPKEDLKIIFSDIVESKPEKKVEEKHENQNDIYSETLADIYIEQGNYEHALKIYEGLLKEKPEKSEAIFKKIDLLLKYLNKK